MPHTKFVREFSQTKINSPMELQELITPQWLEERLDLPKGSITGLDVASPSSSEGFLGNYFFVSIQYIQPTEVRRVKVAEARPGTLQTLC